MLALIYDGQLRLDDRAPKPAAARGEVLIQVRMAGICATDLEITRGYMNYRGILGHEFVGTVVEGPPHVLGKRVVAEINCVCGRCDMCSGGLANHCRRRTVIGIDGQPGAFAEFIAVPESNCHVVPDSVPDDESVFVEPLAAAFQVMRQVKIETNTKVTVLGSGRLGLLVAQVLALSRCRLTVLGRNAKTLGLLERKGIQTTTEAELRGSFDQDVAVDCTGSADGLALAMRVVRPRGIIVIKTTVAHAVPVDLAPIVVNELTLIGSRCGPFDDALAALANKRIDVRSLVTRVLSLRNGIEAMHVAGQSDCIKVLFQVAG